MKKLIMLSLGKKTSDYLAIQLEKVFGEFTTIEAYSMEDEFDFNIEDSLLVLSSTGLIEMDPRLEKLIANGLDYVEARRVINHNYISELLNLPKGTDVLLVNDREDTACECIEQLKALGINHINYFPYYPDIESYPKKDIAVTVGEPQLVPEDVKQIIDIKIRQHDIITLSEIAKKLGLMEEMGNSFNFHYLQDIISLLYKVNTGAKELKITSNRLQTVANHMKNAIIYVNNNGNIILSNQEMYNLLGYENEEIVGENIENILPEIKKIKANSVDIIRINGKELFVTSDAICDKNSDNGIIYTFEKREEIEKSEYEIRRRTTKAISTKLYTFDDIVYESREMKRLIDKVKAFSKTDFTILIQGESGTGKELIAQAIHSESKRSDGPFVPVNFAAMPMNLIESELFGYEEGAFTGAKKGGKRGLFEEAHGGTIFLDEIGDASLEFQCSLLRVIQERQVRRVGGYKEIPIDVRIIAATNRDLMEEIKKGNFRADLYYRLNVLPVRVLGLRERKSDIWLLSKYFLTKYSNGKITSLDEILDEEAINELFNYSWPGNVRQLENAMEYIVCIGNKNKKLDKTELPEYIKDNFHREEDSLIGEVLGEDMIWVLSQLLESEGLGRRHLAELAEKQNIPLTEGQIRSLLNNAQSLGLVESNIGRKGTILTEKGNKLIYSLK